MCERYLSSILRFIKFWCNTRPRETLSFELQQNGDVYCYKKRFKVASRHFLVNNILPDEYIRDLYPAPPPQPKPNWPGKRGRKGKIHEVRLSTRPRRVMCYWKLPRYSEVEESLPSTPPRYVFRPQMKTEGTQNSTWEESGGGSFFPDPGWWKLRKEWMERGKDTKRTQKSRGRSQNSTSNPTHKRTSNTHTNAQVSRSVEKRARDWYNSTVSSTTLPKQFIFEQTEDRPVDTHHSTGSESEEKTTTTTINEDEIQSAKLPKRKPGHKQRKRKYGKDTQPIREDDEAYLTFVKYPQPVIGGEKRKIPRMKGLQRIKKVYPVPPVPEDDASYVKVTRKRKVKVKEEEEEKEDSGDLKCLG